MKIRISYRPQEQETAKALFQAARQILPRARVHRVKTYSPVIQLYLTAAVENKPPEGTKSD